MLYFLIFEATAAFPGAKRLKKLTRRKAVDHKKRRSGRHKRQSEGGARRESGRSNYIQAVQPEIQCFQHRFSLMLFHVFENQNQNLYRLDLCVGVWLDMSVVTRRARGARAVRNL